MPKILLFICVCIFISPFATAIETGNTESNFDFLLNHTNYTVANGLSQDTVTAITQGLIILDRFSYILFKNKEIKNSLIDLASVIK
ncbi:hypothetical protein [Shewanella saliphila]|uniref:Uncharacterized protein n=1 Tax=Shewanella saliphila TaxID=2282698 RepID=A0ABQ2Q9F0_9GAMM|nr:hypothetical protein [Shewanella saliphila]MCL1103500.1 hypothetical protein [Shewanella saliphila]GGP65465.1 hypothetical protein GCM10009409_33500 [Shewanella saliphila]